MADTTKLTRSKAVGIRLDPRTVYLAKIASAYLSCYPGLAKKSLSSFAEWALRYVLREDVIERIEAEFEPNRGRAIAPKLWNEDLWSEDEATRFYNLASLHPTLLSPAEANLWKLFCMYMDHSGQKISEKSFRQFWNSPSINTSHLEEESE